MNDIAGPAPSTLQPAERGAISPSSVFDLLSQTFRALGRRFWTLYLVQVGAMLIGVLAFYGLNILLYDELIIAVNRSRSSPATWGRLLWTVIGGLLAVIVVSQLAQLRAYFVSVAVADRTLAGDKPSFGKMWRDSSGALRRSLSLLGLWYLAGLLGALPIIVTLVYIGQNLDTPDQSNRAVVVGLMFLASILWMCILSVVQVFLFVRWVFVGQLLTLGKVKARDSLRCSWRLTSGAFMRTVGRLIVGSFIAAVPIVGALAIGTVFGAKIISRFDSVGESENLGQFESALTSVLIRAVLLSLLVALILALVNVFLVVYVTAMYRDQCYRASLKRQGVDLERPIFRPRVPVSAPNPANSLPSVGGQQAPPGTGVPTPPPPGGAPHYRQVRSPWDRPQESPSPSVPDT